MDIFGIALACLVFYRWDDIKELIKAMTEHYKTKTKKINDRVL